MRGNQREPDTEEEWREAVLAACALRMIHDCKLYGLLEGGPEINVPRCDELIEKGRSRGIVFGRAEIMDAARQFCNPPRLDAGAVRGA